MTELTRAETHAEDYVDRKIIHNEDVSQVGKLEIAVSKMGGSLKSHIKENRKQIKAEISHNEVTDATLSDIQNTLKYWSPFITAGMEKSKAYKLVADDMKSRSKNLKWWGAFVLIFISVMYYSYLMLEKAHIVK